MATVDLSEDPTRYRVGRGEQGVFGFDPYKSELLPHWRFKTPEDASASAARIYEMFLAYLEAGDLPGADMARKYVQMGKTRSLRYARHKSGKKYDGPVPDEVKGQSGAHGREELPLDVDPVKQRSAEIFTEYLERIEADEEFVRLRSEWRARYG